MVTCDNLFAAYLIVFKVVFKDADLRRTSSIVYGEALKVSLGGLKRGCTQLMDTLQVVLAHAQPGW